MDAGSFIRVLLAVTVVLMAGLSLVYLSQRDLKWKDSLGWVLLALLAPLLGPFLVIYSRPGKWRKPPEQRAARHPARMRVFALAVPRRRNLLRPVLFSQTEKKDDEI